MSTEFYGIKPLANKEAIIQWNSYRFTVLTDRCIRIEYSEELNFQDQATLSFVNRQMPVPKFNVEDKKETIEISTEYIILTAANQKPTAENLTITAKDGSFTWHFLEEPKQPCFGTTRTLDGVKGPCKLDHGLVNRDGFAFINDSNTPIIQENGIFEVGRGIYDIYFFGYGTEYSKCIQDYLVMSGRPPMLPRYCYGIWWSRYWPYTADEMLAVADDFSSHGIPLSVYVIDMEWHIVDTGNASSGWTGYTWNRKLIPDPDKLLAELKKRGLAITMNLHPADGVWPHEDQYEEYAKRLGVTPPNPVKFNSDSPEFMKAYFEILHHPDEKRGVDFWWVDWQQGLGDKIDPLITLNHQHTMDNGRDRSKRPLILSRWCGYGGQRYPIGFSGDTIATFASLEFQPYFTFTAANVGFSFWSHDIGGHCGGDETPELFIRWTQFGAMNPIFRMHSTRNNFHERLPWGYDKEIEYIGTWTMGLHSKLAPLFYSVGYKNYAELVPAVRPMYHLYPKEDAAYACPTQYLVTDDIIMSPYVTPAPATLGFSEQAVWLPEGTWYDWITGRRYEGGWHLLHGFLDHIPVLVRGGGIFPTTEKPVQEAIPEQLRFEVFPGSGCSFELFEDDGISQDYKTGKFHITVVKTGAERLVSFESKGDQSILPKDRVFEVVFRCVKGSKIEVANCEASVEVKENDTIVTLTKFTYPFSVKLVDGEEVVINRPTQKMAFRMIKAADFGSFNKDIFYNELIKTDFAIDTIMGMHFVPEELRRAFLAEYHDLGFYKYPLECGIDSIIFFNNRGIDKFTYSISRVSEEQPTGTLTAGVVPKEILLKREDHKTAYHHFFKSVYQKSNMLLNFGGYMCYTVNFDE